MSLFMLGFSIGLILGAGLLVCVINYFGRADNE